MVENFGFYLRVCSSWKSVRHGPKDWYSIPDKSCFTFCTTWTKPGVGSVQLPIRWILGALSSGLMCPERETDEPPNQCRGYRMRGALSSLPQPSSWRSALVRDFPSWLTLTHQLTPCSCVLEKPPVAQLLKNFQTFYGTRRFITVFERTRRLSPSRNRWIQFIPVCAVCVGSILLLPSHLCLGVAGGLLPSDEKFSRELIRSKREERSRNCGNFPLFWWSRSGGTMGFR
jgi:hypothetical protein